MANASNGVVVGSTAVVLFRSARDRGADHDGVTAITVINTSANDMLVNVKGAADPAEFGLLPAGKSATFEVEAAGDGNVQIDRVTAKRAGGSDAEASVMVTGWR